jgi:hypothetical protein
VDTVKRKRKRKILMALGVERNLAEEIVWGCEMILGFKLTKKEKELLDDIFEKLYDAETQNREGNKEND